MPSTTFTGSEKISSFPPVALPQHGRHRYYAERPSAKKARYRRGRGYLMLGGDESDLGGSSTDANAAPSHTYGSAGRAGRAFAFSRDIHRARA